MYDEKFLREYAQFLAGKLRHRIRPGASLGSILYNLAKIYREVEKDLPMHAEEVFKMVLDYLGDPPVRADPETVLDLIQRDLYNALEPVAPAVIAWLSGEPPGKAVAKAYLLAIKKEAVNTVEKIEMLVARLSEGQLSGVVDKCLDLAEAAAELSVTAYRPALMTPLNIDTDPLADLLDEAKNHLVKAAEYASIAGGIKEASHREQDEAASLMVEHLGKAVEQLTSVIHYVDELLEEMG